MLILPGQTAFLFSELRESHKNSRGCTVNGESNCKIAVLACSVARLQSVCTRCGVAAVVVTTAVVVDVVAVVVFVSVDDTAMPNSSALPTSTCLCRLLHP